MINYIFIYIHQAVDNFVALFGKVIDGLVSFSFQVTDFLFGKSSAATSSARENQYKKMVAKREKEFAERRKQRKRLIARCKELDFSKTPEEILENDLREIAKDIEKLQKEVSNEWPTKK